MNLCESFYYKFWVGIIHNENLYTKKKWMEKVQNIHFFSQRETFFENLNFWLLLVTKSI